MRHANVTIAMYLRSQLASLIYDSDQYKQITSTLHDKYKEQIVDEEYPEAYWSEFSKAYGELIHEVMVGDPNKLTFTP